jgi:hypothetical protein
MVHKNIRTIQTDAFFEGLEQGREESKPALDQANARIAELEARLAMATRFDWPHYANNHFRVVIEHRGDNAWAVTDGANCCWNGDEWEHERSPSNRSENFISRTRFTIEEAFTQADNAQSNLDEAYYALYG